MRWEDLPHQTLELKDRVGNIKNRQKPLVIISSKRELRLHSRDFGISSPSAENIWVLSEHKPDITSVQERK